MFSLAVCPRARTKHLLLVADLLSVEQCSGSSRYRRQLKTENYPRYYLVSAEIHL